MTLTSIKTERFSMTHLLAAGAVVALGAWATIDAWSDIYLIAEKDEEYSHIFIVPLIAFVLVWIRKMRFRHCRPSGTILGPLMVAVGWFLYRYGFNDGVQALYHAGAVLTVLGCAVSILGKNVLFRFAPAVGVLVFLVPVPGGIRQAISLPLQGLTAEAAQVLLQIMGVDAEVSGNTLSINGTLVTIAEACNGMRGLFALILVAYTFSFALPLRNSVRFTVLLLSPVAALLVNVLRTLPTIWLYGYASHDFADSFHTWSGWAMLPAAFMILYGCIQLLKWAAVPVTRYPLASQSA